MKKMITWFIFGVCGTSLFGQTLTKRVGEVKYISKQSYYINLGSGQGLSVGDTVFVIRNNRVIGKLLVENIAKQSSACKLLVQKQTIKQGDSVTIFVRILNDETIDEKSNVQKNRKPERISKSAQNDRRSSRRSKKRNVNRIKGRFGLQSIWFDDMGNSNFDYHQLALRTKLKVEQFFGLPMQLRFRWRSRAHTRERVLSHDISDSEWTHYVYELGLVYDHNDSPYEFGFGRILSRQIRGLGYIDGGLFSIKMNNLFRFGLAGGTQPSLRDSHFQTEEQKFGIFLNFERGEYQTQRISSTIAFSGRYHGGEVSREFIYMQNNFWKGMKFSIYQTVELDFNRGWKQENGKSKLQLSNFYISTRYRPFDFLSLTFSYDARKNIRVYETRSIPDSLFDETTRQGLHTGIILRLTNRIRLSGNFGIRFRKGNLKNTLSASGALRVRNIFQTWATFNARFSYFSTMFTKGYRPTVNIRIPVLRNLSFNLGGGSYIYQTGSLMTNSNWLETDGYYRINRWLFMNFGYRLFLDNRLKSGRLFLETGVVF
ncbi:MAG: hypothetical protein ACE5JB_03185 [bacterium]